MIIDGQKWRPKTDKRSQEYSLSRMDLRYQKNTMWVATAQNRTNWIDIEEAAVNETRLNDDHDRSIENRGRYRKCLCSIIQFNYLIM